MQADFLSRFTPSMMAPELLEATFVQREALAQRITNFIRDSAFTSSKHHTLLVGPRGIGKTHLVSVIYHRISAMEDLHDRLLIAWLREEEWGVTSLLDLLLRIFRALPGDCRSGMLDERVESLYELTPDIAERQAGLLLKEIIGSRTLLVIAENLGDLFDGLGENGQKRLRAYLQENPFITILATAQSLFNGISFQTSPFYGFFHIYHLGELSLDDAILLLTKIAGYKGDENLARFIFAPLGRARIRAVHHLAGGNHRVFVIFSEFLTRESLDKLVDPFMRTVDDLTPYYQSRMTQLSPQQRKIIEFLVERRHAMAVKEIAKYCQITQQTASAQLKVLRESGYVRSIAVGRESYYELREALMRFCVEVKRYHGDAIPLFVDFLRLWYSPTELHDRLMSLQPSAGLERRYLLRALESTKEETEDPRVTACVQDIREYFGNRDYARARQAAEELTVIRGNAWDWVGFALCQLTLDEYTRALESCDRAIQIDPKRSDAWVARALALNELDRNDEALESVDRAIELNPKSPLYWIMKGMILQALDRWNESLEAVDKAIGIDSSSALAWSRRGKVLILLDRREEASNSYDKAIELDPNEADYWTGSGVSLSFLGSYEKAVKAFDESVRLEKNDAFTWGTRSLALVALHRYDEALKSIDEAVRLDPSNTTLLVTKASILGDTNRFEEALGCIDETIRRGGDTPTTITNRARFLLALDRWEEGLAVLEGALRMNIEEALVSENAARIVQDLMRKAYQETYYARIAALVGLYEKHKLVSALATGVVRSISQLTSSLVSDAAVRAWVHVWQSLAGNRPEFRLPLRLMNAAVAYRDTHDARVLLELPAEEREILRQLGFEDKTFDSPQTN